MIPILIILGIIILIISLIGGVVYVIVSKSQKISSPDENVNSKVKISEIISNFFNLILLIINIISIIMIIFSVIDVLIKENISNSNYYNYSDLHSSIALISITLPLHLVLSYYIRKEHIKNIKEGNSPVKKFTIGATVIASLIAICGSLFSIIYQYLEGEISSRFIAKVIFSLILSIILFLYYRLIYTKGQLGTIKYQNIFGILSSIFIISACIYSIVLTGSPDLIRKQKLDEIRLNNLSSIQQSVLSYWQNYKLLPNDLVSMTNAMSNTAVPKDPKSNEPYEYEIVTQSKVVNNITSSATFKICAKFETIRDNSKKFEELKTQDYSKYNSIKDNEFNSYYPMDESPFWNHKAERTCFIRTIDPMIFQPKTEVRAQPIIQ